jgi:hypothetical protein
MLIYGGNTGDDSCEEDSGMYIFDLISWKWMEGFKAGIKAYEVPEAIISAVGGR